MKNSVALNRSKRLGLIIFSTAVYLATGHLASSAQHDGKAENSAEPSTLEECANFTIRKVGDATIYMALGNNGTLNYFLQPGIKKVLHMDGLELNDKRLSHTYEFNSPDKGGGPFSVLVDVQVAIPKVNHHELVKAADEAFGLEGKKPVLNDLNDNLEVIVDQVYSSQPYVLKTAKLNRDRFALSFDYLAFERNEDGSIKNRDLPLYMKVANLPCLVKGESYYGVLNDTLSLTAQNRALVQSIVGHTLSPREVNETRTSLASVLREASGAQGKTFPMTATTAERLRRLIAIDLAHSTPAYIEQLAKIFAVDVKEINADFLLQKIKESIEKNGVFERAGSGFSLAEFVESFQTTNKRTDPVRLVHSSLKMLYTQDLRKDYLQTWYNWEDRYELKKTKDADKYYAEIAEKDAQFIAYVKALHARLPDGFREKPEGNDTRDVKESVDYVYMSGWHTSSPRYVKGLREDLDLQAVEVSYDGNDNRDFIKVRGKDSITKSVLNQIR